MGRLPGRRETETGFVLLRAGIELGQGAPRLRRHEAQVYLGTACSGVAWQQDEARAYLERRPPSCSTRSGSGRAGERVDEELRALSA